MLLSHYSCTITYPPCVPHGTTGVSYTILYQLDISLDFNCAAHVNTYHIRYTLVALLIGVNLLMLKFPSTVYWLLPNRTDDHVDLTSTVNLTSTINLTSPLT